jgi:ABC-type lipoprotein export system ATPase subunit
VTRPDVVLADEPTGNLDSHSEEDVLELLAGVHAEGATIVMVTHSREVAEHGTRIVHVLDGVIDADETLASTVRS